MGILGAKLNQCVLKLLPERRSTRPRAWPGPGSTGSLPEDLIPEAAVAGSMTRYLLALSVGTDWDRFQWLKRNARGAAAADRLTEALALIRGEPLGASTTRSLGRARSRLAPRPAPQSPKAVRARRVVRGARALRRGPDLEGWLSHLAVPRRDVFDQPSAPT